MKDFFLFMFAALVIATMILVLFAAFRAYMAEEKLRKKELAESEAPYKLEPQEQTGGYPPLDVAFPDNPAHEAIKWTYANAPKPKRKYTKRSKYWAKPKQKTTITKAEHNIAKKLGISPAVYARKLLTAGKPKPKRKYTKRSKYWTTNKPAKRMQKARAAKRKTKSK